VRLRGDLAIEEQTKLDLVGNLTRAKRSVSHSRNRFFNVPTE
jgi:hypothetical protein